MIDGVWMPAFACPDCRWPVVADREGHRCESCGVRFECCGGIHRFLGEPRRARVATFLEQYRAVRRADGHALESIERFRALPEVRSDDPNAGEWHIRQQSFETFLKRVCGRSAAGLRVLDAGAGCGWLSHRLATLGATAVAVDLDDDLHDGLGVAARAASRGVSLVQADFDALPFQPAQFDAVVLNASLHYSPDPVRTLLNVERMVASGGALVVMDSPMFVRAEDGEAMAREQASAIAPHAARPPIRPGAGFVTFEQLRAVAACLGRRAQFLSSCGPIGWRLRRAWSRRRLGRAPAAFGVWVAR